MTANHAFNKRLADDASVRRKRLIALRDSGLTYKAIGKLEGGISASRVEQIISKRPK